MLRLDAIAGTLNCLVPQEEWTERDQAKLSSREADHGTGRELFGHMRQAVNEAESGASVFMTLRS